MLPRGRMRAEIQDQGQERAVHGAVCIFILLDLTLCISNLVTKRKASIVACALKYSRLSRQVHHLRHSKTWLGCQSKAQDPNI